MNSEDLMSVFADCTMNEGATSASLDDLLQWVAKPLPSAYLELMRRSNGIEGPVGEDNYIMLWPVEEIKELNEGYAVAEFAPGLLLIGSDGGGTGYAFDTRHDSMPVVEVPFVGMSHEEAETVGSSVEDFIEYLRGGG